MKRSYLPIALLAAIFILGACSIILQRREQEGQEEKKMFRLGMTLYRGDDSFINNIRGKVEESAKAYEKEMGIKIALDVVDAKGDQNTQNRQVDRFISLGMDALCVNIVDRSAASYIISKAMDADIPVVFFNREPVEEDMRRWEKLYYIGEDAKESATLQGNILVDAYKKDPSTLDMNGDGKISYVLLEGESSHQDSLIRTEWTIQTLKDGGLPLEKIAGGIGNWERSQGSAWMEQWLEEYPDEIELVISNNDDMALGAADALDRKGITKPVRVMGIDGTPQGMEGIRDGKLFGTVQCNSEEFARSVFQVAAAAGLGQSVRDYIDLKDGTYYYCSQSAITAQDK